LDWLKENGPHTPKRIYEGMKNDGEERSLSTVKTLLGKMVKDGSLVNQSGLYSAPEAPETPPGKQKPPDTETPAPSITPELFEDAILAAVTDTADKATERAEPIPPNVPPSYEEHYNSAVDTFMKYGRRPEQARREAIKLVCEYAGFSGGGPP
jgi:hypothetical protein